MGIEAFPEIENFQKLPKQVIVKGGSSSFDEATGATLSGIVINNSGHSIRDIQVKLVVFNEKQIPILNISTDANPESLPQGGIGAFTFKIDGHQKEVTDYYLYSKWRFDDRE